MPPLRQPTTLRTMTMDYCIETLLRVCIQLSEKYSGEKFRLAISTVRRNVCSYVPEYFLGELVNAVIDKFHRRGNSLSAHKHVTELLMDVNVIGLRIGARFVNQKDVNRFRGVVELDMRQFDFNMHRFFKNCRLSLLRKASVPTCRDRDLKVIGQKCPRLQSLILSGSSITDKGLRTLSQCQDLRVVDITNCQHVSRIGINHLIGELNKLDSFSCGTSNKYFRNHSDGCSFLSCLDRPSSSMKCFRVITDVVTDMHLRLVVEKFPNLIRCEIGFKSLGDLSILKSLHDLEAIGLKREYSSSNQDDASRIWRSLEELWSFTGETIKALQLINLGERSVSHPGNLSYILEACHNIEHLYCTHGFPDLVIPSAQNLRALCLDTDKSLIEFDVEKTGNMLKLECLDLCDIAVPFETIKSIILDDVKFPKLSVLKTAGLTSEESDEIDRITKNKNLNFYWSSH